MKTKILILLSIFAISSIIVACFDPINKDYNTQIQSIDVSNAKLENSYYKKQNSSNTSFGNYCVLVDFVLEDRLLYTQNWIKNISLVQNTYAA